MKKLRCSGFSVRGASCERQIGAIMNFLDFFVMTQQSEIEKPTLFPFPFNMHLVFACIGAIFFAYRFFTQRRPFQLIMAVAIPLSLIIWISESKTVFYGLGIIEALLILAAVITSFIFKVPENKESVKDDGESSDNGSGESEDVQTAEENL